MKVAFRVFDHIRDQWKFYWAKLNQPVPMDPTCPIVYKSTGMQADVITLTISKA